MSIPPGLELDHFECDNPPCADPDHLRPTTSRENILRSLIAPAAINARTTHCPKGHSLDDCYVRTDGRRRCRTCEKDSAFRRQRAQLGIPLDHPRGHHYNRRGSGG